MKININDKTPAENYSGAKEGLYKDSGGDVWLFIEDIAVCFYYSGNGTFYQQADSELENDYGPFTKFTGTISLEQ